MHCFLWKDGSYASLLLCIAELLVQNCGLTSLPEGIGTLPLLRTLILEGKY